MNQAPTPLASLALLALLAPAFAACSGDEHDAGDLYRTHCVRCHSADGRGDRRSVGLYPDLDLTSSPLVRAGSRARGLMYRRISEGYGAMPAFGDRLETADLEKLVDYVLRLASTSRATSAAAPAAAPTNEECRDWRQPEPRPPVASGGTPGWSGAGVSPAFHPMGRPQPTAREKAGR